MIIIFFLIINLLNLIFIKKLVKIYNIFDYPDNFRKTHTSKISVIGGFLIQINWILLSFLVFFNKIEFKDFIANNRNFFSIFIITFFIFLIGVLDDKKLLKNNLKFFFLFVIILFSLLIDENIILTSITFSWLEREILLLNISVIFTIFCILTFVNAFNFMDGINLLCGLYALIVFLVFFYISKSFIFVPIIFSLVVFCILNYKNITFLGDAGSLSLSYLISIFVIKFYKLSFLNTEQILILLTIPVIDNIRVFVNRFINGKNILMPDATHFHHLLQNKMQKNKVVFLILSIIFIPFFLSFLNLINYLLLTTQLLVYLIFIKILIKKKQ